jgi:hypothetical protein
MRKVSSVGKDLDEELLAQSGPEKIRLCANLEKKKTKKKPQELFLFVTHLRASTISP